jgi:hypothetical protein
MKNAAKQEVSKKFDPSTLKRITVMSGRTARREKTLPELIQILSEQIDKQIALAKDDTKPAGKENGGWFGELEDGKWWVGLFYSTKRLDCVEAESRDDVPATFEALKQLAIAGEYNAVLSAQSTKRSAGRRKKPPQTNVRYAKVAAASAEVTA